MLIGPVIGFAVWIVCIWVVWKGLKKGVEIVKAVAVPALRMATFNEPRQFKPMHNYY